MIGANPPEGTRQAAAPQGQPSLGARPAAYRFGFIALLSAVASCAVVSSVERPAPGGVYREAVVGQPLSLNPLLDPFDPITRDVARLAFAGLVRVTDGGEIQGDLAERWTTDAEGRSYVFYLRRGALWHDGQPVTAADVLTTVSLVQSDGYPGPAEIGALWRRVRAEAIDSHTVRLALDQPYSSFIEACSLPLLPAHIFGTQDASALRDHASSYQPVAAGPFRVHGVSEDGIRLVRHEGYPGPRPYLEEVQLRFYPDTAGATAALLNREVDGMAGIGAAGVVARAEERQLAVQSLPLTGHQSIVFLNQRNPILADSRVRRAIAAAIDRAQLLAGTLAGEAVPAYGPIPSYSWAYARFVETTPDVPAARALLDEAGWVGTTVRTQGGRPLRLELSVPLDLRLIALAEELKIQLQLVGVQIDLQPAEQLDLYRERLAPGRFDLALLGLWLGTVDPDPYPLWHSSVSRTGLNLASYRRGEVDALLEAARLDGDPGRRRSALEAFQRLWLEDVPGVVLTNPVMTYAVSREIRGTRVGTAPEPGARFQHIAEWYVRTESFPALFW